MTNEDLVIGDDYSNSVEVVTIKQFDRLVQTLVENKAISQMQVNKIYKGE